MATKNPCILIPSYNEVGTIGGIVKKLIERRFTVYVVDDGSTDDTASVARSEGAIVVKHSKNMGKGASIREGFKHILKRSFDSAVIMDADNQHEVEDLDFLIKKMEESGADMVIGNRMEDTSRMPMIRILVNRFMSLAISMLCGQKVPDTQCGFRLINIDVLRKIELRSSNYEIESELIIRASRLGFKIASIPIKTVYQDETSKINPITDTIRFIMFIIKIMFSR